MNPWRDVAANTVRCDCTPLSRRIRLEQAASPPAALRILREVPPTAAEIADQLYARWNADGLAVLTDSVDPEIELVCDPLRPAESTLRGIDGWKQWVARWEDAYESMRITIDGLIPISAEHVLALVSIKAKPRRGKRDLAWAAAHVWTVRDGRIARWETHVDLALARGTLM